MVSSSSWISSQVKRCSELFGRLCGFAVTTPRRVRTRQIVASTGIDRGLRGPDDRHHPRGDPLRRFGTDLTMITQRCGRNQNGEW